MKGVGSLNKRPKIGPIFRVLLTATLMVAGLLLSALAAPTAQAQETEPTITVSPSSGIVGKRIRVTGYGFPLSTNLALLLDGARVGNAFTDDSGSLYASFSVPTRPGGVYRVSVEGAAPWDSQLFPLFRFPQTAVLPAQRCTSRALGFMVRMRSAYYSRAASCSRWL